MAKTILRVLDYTELSPELLNKLKELFPELCIERYSEKPNSKRSIQRRINSLHAAFLFVLDAYPLDPTFTLLTKEALISFAQDALHACDLSSDTLAILHRELERFKGILISMLLIGWPWTGDSDKARLKAAVACLNEAEQYLLMRAGRPDMATLITMDFGHGPQYFLQWDESLPPYSPQWLAELALIKAHPLFVTPTWLRELKEHEYAYLFNAEPSLSPQELIDDLQCLLTEVAIVKKLALNWSADLQKIHEQKPPFPDWYTKLSKARQEMLRALAAPSTAVNLEHYVVTFKGFLKEKNTNSAFATELKKSTSLPLWYLLLSPHQQAFLKYVLKDAGAIEEVVSFLPSRLRTLPAPANFGSHSILKIVPEGIQALSAARKRSAHVGSRDSHKNKWPEMVQRLHCENNLKQVMSYATPEQIIIFQTLVSPIYVLTWVPKIILAAFPVELPPDLPLYQQAQTALSNSEYAARTFQHNHPFNMARFLYYTTVDDPYSLDLIKQTKAAIAALKQRLAKSPNPATKLKTQQANLEQLLDSYIKVLYSSPGSATIFDYEGRELFLSSLEQLIVLEQGGYSYGSCVSGKDRKALELMHTDAMLVYKDVYGVWPSFADQEPNSQKNRKNFVSIFVSFYVSRHQQELAGQNAPGSEGIKTPKMYLPSDICREIQRRLGVGSLAYDDRLATDNEVKKISERLDDYLIPEQELIRNLIARQLGEEWCTQLYNSLLPLLNEKHLFKPKPNKRALFFANPPMPTGIVKINELMNEPSAGNTNVERVAKIIEIVRKRPNDDDSRTPATEAVYAMRDFFELPTNHAALATHAKSLVEHWTILFNQSKVEFAKGKSSDEEVQSLGEIFSSL